MIPDENFIIYTVLGLLLIVSFIWLIRLQLRIKKLFRGHHTETIEELLLIIGKEVEKLHQMQEITDSTLKDINGRLKKSLQHVKMIRFNPFKGLDGGNQSFAFALLNEDGDGVVISSLYAREKMTIFAKPIKNYTSKVELTGEEKEVVKKS